MAMIPPVIQIEKNKNGVGEVAATLAGVRKMPMPITRLTIIIVKSKRFSFDLLMI